jgi:hypothetical protein
MLSETSYLPPGSTRNPPRGFCCSKADSETALTRGAAEQIVGQELGFFCQIAGPHEVSG